MTHYMQSLIRPSKIRRHSIIHRVSRDVHIDMGLLIARALELIDRKEMRGKMGQNGCEKEERTYTVKTEILRFQAL